ncbi:MAG: hypothetical protein AUG49_15950 [Catenulispora sp. 13_1_20CM_3_70_7]|nr:MAG: hypothetical protein AUG49_15950 [Catenulispora sp. 13_1_20CM_3_70_7]
MPSFQLAPGQPAVFIGPMRSGKSNLIAWHLQPAHSAVIIDSKRHPDEWAAWAPRHGYVVTDDPKLISQHPKVVWQVSMHTLLDVPGFRKPGALGYGWTEGLSRIMQRGSTIVVFDELAHQLPAGRPHPSAVQILTQGGAYKLSAWGGSQYANRVETMILRGAVHCFGFKLNPFDLKVLGERRGAEADVLQELPTYGFAYHATNTPAWQLCAPVERVM